MRGFLKASYGSAGGAPTSSRSLQATSWGRVPTQCVNLVLDKFILLFSTSASACKNQTSGESVQNVGSFMETVVKGTKPQISSLLGFLDIPITFNTEHSQKNSQNFWNAYFGILGVKNTWTRSKPKSSATKSHWSYQNVAKLRNEINKWIVIFIKI